jgi:hypothetical protein
MTAASYTVICRGELRGDRDQARQGLAELFGIDADGVEEVLQGHRILRCGPLPRQPAHQLWRRLERSGVVAYLDVGAPDVIDPSAVATQCRRCRVRRLRPDQCGACGLNAAPQEVASDEPPTESDEAARTRLTLRRSLQLVIVLLCLDQMVRWLNNWWLSQLQGPLVEVGNTLIIAVFLVLAYAVWRYARLQRRPLWARLLGVTGPLGLAVLMLWDVIDGFRESGRLRYKGQLILGISSLLLAGNWIYGLGSAHYQWQALESRAVALREAMPLATLAAESPPDGDASAMGERVDGYLNEAWQALLAGNFKQGNGVERVDETLAIFARHIMWHNRLLISRHSSDDPLARDEFDAIRAAREQRFRDLAEPLPPYDLSSAVGRGFNDWRSGYFRHYDRDVAQANKRFSRRLGRLRRHIQRGLINGVELDSRVPDALERFLSDERYAGDYQNRRLRITVKQGPQLIQGRSTIYGWLPLRGSDSGYVEWEMLRIGGDLPDKFLDSGRGGALPRVPPEGSKTPNTNGSP